MFEGREDLRAVRVRQDARAQHGLHLGAGKPGIVVGMPAHDGLPERVDDRAARHGLAVTAAEGAGPEFGEHEPQVGHVDRLVGPDARHHLVGQLEIRRGRVEEGVLAQESLDEGEDLLGPDLDQQYVGKQRDHHLVAGRQGRAEAGAVGAPDALRDLAHRVGVGAEGEVAQREPHRVVRAESGAGHTTLVEAVCFQKALAQVSHRGLREIVLDDLGEIGCRDLGEHSSPRLDDTGHRERVPQGLTEAAPEEQLLLGEIGEDRCGQEREVGRQQRTAAGEQGTLPGPHRRLAKEHPRRQVAPGGVEATVQPPARHLVGRGSDVVGEQLFAGERGSLHSADGCQAACFSQGSGIEQGAVMNDRHARTELGTHRVENQPTALADVNLWAIDAPLREAVEREGAGWAGDAIGALGSALGSAETLELGRLANENPPRLRAFDGAGRRLDEIEYHSAYHALMRLGIEHGVPSIAWREPRVGSHIAHVAMTYLFSQAEAGVCCPFTMTYAVVPALRADPAIAAEWEPGVLARVYDSRSVPAGEKRGLTFGMAMTEKQGGSDVRTNTTRAEPIGAGGPGGEYRLTGHKWFCSAAMSDAFLALAQTQRGLSCFLVPRWTPDGRRNPILIQRVKDKLGNRSNASSEIEYVGTWARMLGEDGRGVATILQMVHHTRNDTVAAPAGLMRWALANAIHHARGRHVFGKRLADQPLMQQVLADLAIEVEAATALAIRIGRGFDRGPTDERERLVARLITPAAKYWNNKRAPVAIVEALECLGGAGYVEESPMPRLFRESPLNGIWEGSGNVICLDVLRALGREPECAEFLLDELRCAAGADRHYDAALSVLERELTRRDDIEARLRRLTERIAVQLQAALLVQHAPAPVADLFCATRLGDQGGRTFGSLPGGANLAAVIERALPS